MGPYTHVKDVADSVHKHRHLLLGDGETDLVLLFLTLKKHGYDGLPNVEVSGNIHKQPGYEPIGTARLGYERLPSTFKKAALPRP